MLDENTPNYGINVECDDGMVRTFGPFNSNHIAESKSLDFEEIPWIERTSVYMWTE